MTSTREQSHIHEDKTKEDLEQKKEVHCDNEFVVCRDAHHGVSHSIEGISFSCSFSFQLRKNLSKECRMEYLALLYESMTKRVDDAYNNDLAD
jgi:hypothetical protein